MDNVLHLPVLEKLVVPESRSIEELMLEMSTYGLPTVGMMTKGWYCGVDMNTNAEGASFTVRSDFYHATPRIAIEECIARIKLAVKTIKDKS